MKKETCDFLKKKFLIELLLWSSIPLGFYIILIIFSKQAWSWLWFAIAFILSTISAYFREKDFPNL